MEWRGVAGPGTWNLGSRRARKERSCLRHASYTALHCMTPAIPLLSSKVARRYLMRGRSILFIPSGYGTLCISRCLNLPCCNSRPHPSPSISSSSSLSPSSQSQTPLAPTPPPLPPPPPPPSLPASRQITAQHQLPTEPALPLPPRRAPQRAPKRAVAAAGL